MDNKSIIDFIPEDLRNITLNELFAFENNDHIDISKRDNKVIIKIIRNNIQFTLLINQITMNSVETKLSKEELIKEITRLKKQRISQKNIADILNISQSYVSILSKEAKI